MNNFLSEISDYLVALGNYTPEILSTIKTRSGKFGMLEIIGENPKLVAKLKKLGVIVGATNPTILLPHENPDDVFFKRLQRNVSRFPMELLRYRKENGYHIRGGSPGDMKGLVDVMRTPTIQERFPRESLIQAIEKIRAGAQSQTKEIAYYAEHEGVYWDSDNIQIGVVPTLDLPIVTVTEDPNREDRLFIDTLYDDGKRNGNRVIRRVEYTSVQEVQEAEPQEEVDPNDTSPSAELRRMLSKLNDSAQKLKEAKSAFDGRNPSPEGKDIAPIISLLKESKILDPNMTYQFEFGWIQGPHSKLVLFQVKEFARKNPIDTNNLIKESVLTRSFYGTSITRIITGLKEGEGLQVPIIDGQYRRNIWESVKNGVYPDGFAARPAKNSDDLEPRDYNKDMKVFFHGDAHEGSLVHNSFRFAQSVVRKGGTIFLGLENRPVDHSPKEIGLKVQNGVLKLIIGIGKGSRIDLANLELTSVPLVKKKYFTPKKS